MIRAALLALATLLALPAAAQAGHDAHHAATGRAGTGAAEAMSEGEVRKVDKGAGKVTIKHGPIANLEMPPMTMVFRVKDPGLLDRVKAGDRIRFRAEKLGGNYTVTELESAK